MSTHEAPEAVVAEYREAVSCIPPVRVPFRVDGFQAGYRAAREHGIHITDLEARDDKFAELADDYDRSSRVDGVAVARRRSAHNGFKDGWKAGLQA